MNHQQLLSRSFDLFDLKIVLICTLLISGFTSNAISQRLGIAHQDYMTAVGMEDDFIVMKNILQNELMNRIDDKPEAYYNENAAFFSMVLLLSGVKPTHFYTLQQRDVDIIHAITADIRPFDEQSLFSDVVITGTVVDVIPETINEDGFDITLHIRVSEVLKGGLPSDNIRIRQRNSSRLPGSMNKPEQNESYLFLLSSGMYGYHKANHQMKRKDQIDVSAPKLGHEDIFVIYRLYPFRNDHLLRSPQTKKDAFRAIRWVDSLLRSSESE